jgi:integrase
MQGSFIKKRGSTWTAYYYMPDSTGKRRQRSKGGFGTKEEAQRYLSNTVTSVQTGDYVEPTNLTLGEYLNDQWLPIVQHSIRPSTWHRYQCEITLHVMPTLGGIKLQQLSQSHLDQLYVELLNNGRVNKPGGLSPKTVRSIHNLLHKALKDAQRKQLVHRNVADAADPPRINRSGSEGLRTWNANQVRIFLKGLSGHRLEAAYTLAATTGMRRGEVLGVRWSDIDSAFKHLAVRQTVISVNYELMFGTPKTAKGRRLLALDDITVAALEAHRNRQLEERTAIGDAYIDHDLVFPKLDGSPTHPDYFSQCFDRTVAKLGLPRIRLHDLRHTYATLGLAAGVPSIVISQRLGHANVAFTLDIYTHPVPALHEAAAEQVAGLIFGPDNEEELLPDQTG